LVHDGGATVARLGAAALCLGCNEIVGEPGALCATCWPGFSFISPPHCTRCGAPFAEEIGAGAQCGACLRRPPRFRRARAALVYDDTSRRLVLPFKHGDRTDMARACGGWMARAGAELLAEAELIAPVPLHWRRLFTRRYNQALLLARAAARRSPGRLAPDLLRRARWTGSQSGLRAEERRDERAARLRAASAVARRGAGQDHPAGRRRADHGGHGRGLHARPAAWRGAAR
jgi:predicted amidophosphoribosyltransferase